jgi:hypothetical protein
MTQEQHQKLDATMNEIHDVLTRIMEREVGYALTQQDLQELDTAEDLFEKVRSDLSVLQRD